MAKKLPNVVFRTRVRDESIGGPNPFTWKDVSTHDIFSGKRVLVFSLPGAFTPTCSTFQLPGFEKNYNKIKNMGIDEVYVMAVNDSFVMNKWVKDQCVKNVKVIPDGNGELTDSLGMLVEKTNLGFGKRSWRFAFVANNGNIEKEFVEPGKRNNADDDPYGQTSPETVMAYLESVK